MESPKAVKESAIELLNKKINVITHSVNYPYLDEVLRICVAYKYDLESSSQYTWEHQQLDELITEIVNLMEWNTLIPVNSLWNKKLETATDNLLRLYYGKEYNKVHPENTEYTYNTLA